MGQESSFQPAPELEAGLTAILEIPRCQVGQDFRCLKPNTLVRRIHRRMNLRRIKTLDDYARHLRDNTDEVELLQKDHPSESAP